MANIDRSVVGIIRGSGIVTPGRIPVAVIEEIIACGDQLDPVVALMMPTAIVPFRMIRTEHFVPRTLPAFAVCNPEIRIELHRRRAIGARLRLETCVLLFD